jgi:acyl carrier protein
MTQIIDAVRAFVRENFLFGEPIRFAEDDSLLELGVVDSTGVLELVAFIEERYAVAVADDELVPENLDSIVRIARFVAEKRAAVAKPQAAVSESIPTP